MKTLNVKTIVESANNVINSDNAKKALKSLNKEYKSLSQVLKDLQRDKMLKAGANELFKLVGVNEGITPKELFSYLPNEMFATVTKGRGAKKVESKVAGIFVCVTKKDDEGNVISTEYKLRKVSAWDGKKLFTMLQQARDIKADKKA